MTSEFAIAVHALVYLNHKAMTLSSELLAENVCTNPARIRKVMAKLGRAGLVATKEGAVGGYSFELKPQEVNLRQICDAVDSPIVSSGWKPGDSCMECLVASGMAGIMDGIYEQLNQCCRQRLEAITIADIDGYIFRKN